MRSIFRGPNLGIALAICSPFIAVACAGWQAFIPVALTSVLSATICLMTDTISTPMAVGALTAELVQELVCADERTREMVLSCLTKKERDWFMAEVPRAQAELRRRNWQPRVGKRASAHWLWRLRLLRKVA